MQPDVTDLDHLSQVISHALAPAFLLGAVAGFISILIGRMNGILDRVRILNLIADDDSPRARLKSDIPRLKRRAELLNATIRFALASGICVTLLVVLAFGSAFVGLRHEPVAGVLFMLALGLLGAALFTFAREVWIGLNEFDHHA
jgi:hypothetical protein